MKRELPLTDTSSTIEHPIQHSTFNHPTFPLPLRCGIMSHDLLQQFQNNPRLFQLADRIALPFPETQPQKIYLRNLQGSSREFVTAAAFLHPSCARINHVIVLNDAEEAAYFHNTLENL